MREECHISETPLNFRTFLNLQNPNIQETNACIRHTLQETHLYLVLSIYSSNGLRVTLDYSACSRTCRTMKETHLSESKKQLEVKCLDLLLLHVVNHKKSANQPIV